MPVLAHPLYVVVSSAADPVAAVCVIEQWLGGVFEFSLSDPELVLPCGGLKPIVDYFSS
jgi:hypothetical protein